MEKKIKKEIGPVILVILDGWGIAKPNKGNAVSLAKTPVMDGLLEKYPNTTICAHGACVGLPKDQPGNSEAGHSNLGAGRIVDQDVIRITKSIENGLFFKKAAFVDTLRHVKKNKGRLHLMGLLSNGMSPHSDPFHLEALLKLARQQAIEEVCLHLFTDGRDSHRFAALKLIADLEEKLNSNEKIHTIMGRFYAMDRKKKWDRTRMAYDALVTCDGRKASSARQAITEAYNRGESDEFIEPYIIEENGRPLPRIEDGDSIIFFNLRSDRGRQLTKVFVQPDFEKANADSFKRGKKLDNINFIAMTDFGPDLGDVLTAFPSMDIKQTLPMLLSDFRQLYIAETEKYAHVTYFFNGGYPKPVGNEDHFLVPSPDVKSYDQTPGMSSSQLAETVVENVKQGKYDFTVLNFAAPDMIGHTGNLAAAIECCQLVDKNLGEIVGAYLEKNGTVLITADHGNIEAMIDLETDEVLTEHTSNPVPFIVAGKKMKKGKLKKDGILADIAPTVLDLFNIEKPPEMTGQSLFQE